MNHEYNVPTKNSKKTSSDYKKLKIKSWHILVGQKSEKNINYFQWNSQHIEGLFLV